MAASASPFTRRWLLAEACILAAGGLLPFRPATAGEPCVADPLGTARVLPVGTAGGLFVGAKSYPRSLALVEREVVLTFDDGPLPGPTGRVLDALACEQARATFFMIGRNAAASPALVRRVAAEGHTVACHSWSHPLLRSLSPEAGIREVERGFDALRAALGREPAPFFRYPGFADSAAVNDWLAARGIGVFGCEVWASDWSPMAPGTQLDLVLRRLQAAGRGIVLFHDTHAQTASMLPGFLRALKREGFRVAHLEPGFGQAPTVEAPAPWSSETDRMIALARGQRPRRG